MDRFYLCRTGIEYFNEGYYNVDKFGEFSYFWRNFYDETNIFIQKIIKLKLRKISLKMYNRNI
jgi:hypothetical protein